MPPDDIGEHTPQATLLENNLIARAAEWSDAAKRSDLLRASCHAGSMSIGIGSNGMVRGGSGATACATNTWAPYQRAKAKAYGSALGSGCEISGEENVFQSKGGHLPAQSA